MTDGAIFCPAPPSGAPRARISIDVCRRHDFPKTLPDFLLQQWFTLTERDRRATLLSAIRNWQSESFHHRSESISPHRGLENSLYALSREIRAVASGRHFERKRS